MSNMKLYGFYVLSDRFFSKMNDPYLKDNKQESRPLYYCIQEADMYWMIPLSSRVEKYKNIIKSKEEKHKPCDGLYICKLPTGKESAFLIQDIFPITEEYVEREYTIGSNHLILPYRNDIDRIEEKARKVIRLIKRGIKLTPTSPDVIKIQKILTKQ